MLMIKPMPKPCRSPERLAVVSRDTEAGDPDVPHEKILFYLHLHAHSFATVRGSKSDGASADTHRCGIWLQR